MFFFLFQMFTPIYLWKRWIHFFLKMFTQIYLGKRRWTNPFWQTFFSDGWEKHILLSCLGVKKEGWNWNPTLFLLPYFYGIKGFLLDDRIDPLALWRTPTPDAFLVLGKVRVISSSGWFWKNGSEFKMNVLLKADFNDITPKIDLKVSKIMLSCFIQHHSTSFWWFWKRWIFICKDIVQKSRISGWQLHSWCVFWGGG